jgi:hypothetical protein
MKIIYRCFICLLLVAKQYPSSAQNAQLANLVAPYPASSLLKATIPSFNCSIIDNRILLNWSVDANQLADKFILEKSVDGKHFVVAALIFGTDKAGLDEYEFHEKAGSSKTTYRIRILHKDESVTYSEEVLAVPVSNQKKNKSSV